MLSLDQSTSNITKNSLKSDHSNVGSFLLSH